MIGADESFSPQPENVSASSIIPQMVDGCDFFDLPSLAAVFNLLLHLTQILLGSKWHPISQRFGILRIRVVTSQSYQFAATMRLES
jgi:hypothetical protein